MISASLATACTPAPRPACPRQLAAQTVVEPRPSAGPIPAPKTPGGFDIPSGQWLELRVQSVVLHYTSDMHSDATRYAAYIERFHAALTNEFGQEELAQAFARKPRCRLYLLPSETALAGKGHAESRTSAQYCEVFLFPSTRLPASERCCTSAKEPYDEEYDRRVLGHEYAGLAIRGLQRTWRLSTAPDWFLQGYQEYLAAALSSTHTRTVTLSRYRALAVAERDRLAFFAFSNPYVDGAAFQLFLRDTFGDDIGVRILLSPEPTFTRALSRELGIRPADLVSRLQTWADAQRRLHEQTERQ